MGDGVWSSSLLLKARLKMLGLNSLQITQFVLCRVVDTHNLGSMAEHTQCQMMSAEAKMNGLRLKKNYDILAQGH